MTVRRESLTCPGLRPARTDHSDVNEGAQTRRRTCQDWPQLSTIATGAPSLRPCPVLHQDLPPWHDFAYPSLERDIDFRQLSETMMGAVVSRRQVTEASSAGDRRSEVRARESREPGEKPIRISDVVFILALVGTFLISSFTIVLLAPARTVEAHPPSSFGYTWTCLTGVGSQSQPGDCYRHKTSAYDT